MKICHFSHIFQFPSGKNWAKGKRALKSHTISRFGKKGEDRANKKQDIIDRLKAFFEKYSGIGTTPSFNTDDNNENDEAVIHNMADKTKNKSVIYDIPTEDLKVADSNSNRKDNV